MWIAAKPPQILIKNWKAFKVVGTIINQKCLSQNAQTNTTSIVVFYYAYSTSIEMQKHPFFAVIL